MTFRWYGEGNDAIHPQHIAQIPSCKGLVWALHKKAAGEVWPLDEIMGVKRYVEGFGLHIDVVESVNIHEDIKIGKPSRDKYIENYITTLKNLGEAGVKVVCYNFMPVFDWLRTDLFAPLSDGSTALFYEKAKVDGLDPQALVEEYSKTTSKMTLPGWEPERMKNLATLFEEYKAVSEDKLRENLKYFLDAVIPVAESVGISMAIHPDDPPWSIFNLPRIVKSKSDLAKILELNPSRHNGLTLCSGALGANLDNNIPDMVRSFADRIHFAHIRNVKVYENGDFVEVSHRASDGSVDIVEVMRAYYETGYKGYIRPDHGRHIWDEDKNPDCRPGYGLYDRALGIMYMLGAWEMIEKLDKEKK